MKRASASSGKNLPFIVQAPTGSEHEKKKQLIKENTDADFHIPLRTC